MGKPPRSPLAVSGIQYWAVRYGALCAKRPSNCIHFLSELTGDELRRATAVALSRNPEVTCYLEFG